MDLKDLWIGDQLQIISSGKVGTFEGMGANKHARIKINGKEFLIPANDIKPYTPSPEKIDLSDLEEPVPQETEVPWTDQLDLHIEHLRPDLLHALPQMILSYQIERTRAYILEAVKRRMVSVVIIHGKGKGQLKEEVYHLLKLIPEAWHTRPLNDGGAVEVYFKY